MQLRTKLSIVLALLVSTLISNVVFSVWSIRFLERELSTPLQSMESVMQRLYEIKRLGEREIDLVLGSLSTDDESFTKGEQAITSLSGSELGIVDKLNELEALPKVMLRSGITTIDNLRARSEAIQIAKAQWAQSHERADAMNLVELVDLRHELIERIEGQILEDSRLSASFGAGLKTRMYSIILVSLIGALAIGLIMVLFIRRWVFSPIEQLRTGAQRMSQGDFDHPIPVQSLDELGQLSEEFNRMGVLIREMQHRKIEQERLAAMGEMAQRTVHNLRTPLAGIRALSETTLDELDPYSDLRDLQERIITTVDRFEVWLTEMLRTSAPLDLHIDEIHPADLVREVIDAHQDAATSKGVHIRYADDYPPKSAWGDAYHLGHAMTAVISNAIDFAPPSSNIDIHLSQRADNSGTYWTLRVVNIGEMIPQDLHHAIFRPYFTTRKSGTGIGLAMCSRVINQHHGLIEVESPLEGAKQAGCAFTLLIPYSPPSSEHD